MRRLKPVRSTIALPPDPEQVKQALLAFADDLAALALMRYLREYDTQQREKK
jgi:hypothetical protein